MVLSLNAAWPLSYTPDPTYITAFLLAESRSCQLSILTQCRGLAQQWALTLWPIVEKSHTITEVGAINQYALKSLRRSVMQIRDHC